MVSVMPGRAQAGTAGAAAWLVSVENSDGGWGSSPESDSSPSTTAWAMLGLEAAGRNPLDVSSGDLAARLYQPILYTHYR